MSGIMNNSDIELQIKNYKVREGYLYKRSRFKREWRKRLVIITLNFIFTYENLHQHLRLTEKIDLRQVISYTSQLRKDEHQHLNSIVLKTKDNEFAFSTSSENVNEKWSWIVTIERLLNFEQNGATAYNDLDKIRTKGFPSAQQYQFLNKTHSMPVLQYTTIGIQYEQSRVLQQIAALQSKLRQQEKALAYRYQDLLSKQHEIKDIESLYTTCKQENSYLQSKIQSLQEELEVHAHRITNENSILVEIEDNIWKWFVFYMKQQTEEILQFISQILKTIYRRVSAEERKQQKTSIKILCQLCQNAEMISRFQRIYKRFFNS